MPFQRDQYQQIIYYYIPTWSIPAAPFQRDDILLHSNVISTSRSYIIIFQIDQYQQRLSNVIIYHYIPIWSVKAAHFNVIIYYYIPNWSYTIIFQRDLYQQCISTQSYIIKFQIDQYQQFLSNVIIYHYIPKNPTLAAPFQHDHILLYYNLIIYHYIPTWSVPVRLSTWSYIIKFQIDQYQQCLSNVIIYHYIPAWSCINSNLLYFRYG